MKTKQIPYVCPVCHGSGNGPLTDGTSTLPPKCKACGGACVLWGTETDDTIDLSKTFPQPTLAPVENPWTINPYEPYVPLSPYWWQGLYYGDPVWKPSVTWCATNTPVLKNRSKVIKQEDYPQYDLSNFGY